MLSGERLAYKAMDAENDQADAGQECHRAPAPVWTEKASSGVISTPPMRWSC